MPCTTRACATPPNGSAGDCRAPSQAFSSTSRRVLWSWIMVASVDTRHQVGQVVVVLEGEHALAAGVVEAAVADEVQHVVGAAPAGRAAARPGWRLAITVTCTWPCCSSAASAVRIRCHLGAHVQGGQVGRRRDHHQHLQRRRRSAAASRCAAAPGSAPPGSWWTAPETAAARTGRGTPRARPPTAGRCRAAAGSAVPCRWRPPRPGCAGSRCPPRRRTARRTGCCRTCFATSWVGDPIARTPERVRPSLRITFSSASGREREGHRCRCASPRGEFSTETVNVPGVGVASTSRSKSR